MQKVYDSLVQVVATMERCATQGFQLPTLLLAYSTIDAMGWLGAADRSRDVKDRFVAWADRYALPTTPQLQCSALELYAARCGVLHTFTPNSKLTERGVRRVIYAWGTADVSKLQRAAELAGSGKWVAVHLADLTQAVRLGIAQMFEDAETDPELKARVVSASEAFFQSIDRTSFDNLPSADPAA